MAREFGVGDTVSSPRFRPSDHPVSGGYWEKTNDRPVVWTVKPTAVSTQSPQPDNYLHAQYVTKEQ